MPNTSCMIYIMAPANFHNPNSFNFSCTLSIAVEKEEEELAAKEELATEEERATVAEVTVEAVSEVVSPLTSRRSHPAQSGETFDGPPSLERSGSEHRVGRFPPSPLRFLSPANGGTEGGVKTIEEGLGERWSPL